MDIPDYLEIGEDYPYFTDQFCSDIIREAELDYYYWYAAIRSDLELYDKEQQLELIKSKLDELRKNLEGSPYKTKFSVKDMKRSLDICLAKFFEYELISGATQFVYDLTIDKGEYKYDIINKRLHVFPTVSYLFRETQFDFAFLDEYKPLVQYVAWGMFFNKLREIESEIKGIRILDQQALPQQKKQKEISIIPILAVDENGGFIHDELTREENGNVKTEQIIQEALTSEHEYMEDIDENIKEVKSSDQGNNIFPSEADIKGQQELPNGQIKQQTLFLADFFESSTKYNHVLDILVNEKLCAPKTYIWIDEKKGSKGLLVSILKQLHALGYYKKNKKLTNKEIQQICINTFGLDIKIDTIKSTKADTYTMRFLPLAATLDK